MSETNDSVWPRSDQLATAAVVIAAVAFITACSQLISMTISSAKGLPSCDKKVMGKWANPWWKSSKIRFFRLQVKFTAPIILLAHPDNKRGPEPGKPIIYLNGNNWEEIKVDDPVEERTNRREREARQAQRWWVWWRREPQAPRHAGDREGEEQEPVHTVNNELASWVVLLQELQKMEQTAEEWDAKTWEGHHRPSTSQRALKTLAVGIQSKARSFDLNLAVKKPYATTTICHLIELAALLGIYWKKFDRDGDRYRAEGNGYSLLGWRKSDFGLVFTFERFGWPRFKATRIIPVEEVKEFCFGNVPSIFRDPRENKDWGKPFDDFKTPLKVLRMGSRHEIADTVSRIGCPTMTVDLLRNESSVHQHLFPVVFEIIGMIGRRCHLRGTNFTHLPNPTIFHWDQDSFSLTRLLKYFQQHLKDDIAMLEASVANFSRGRLGIIEQEVDRLGEELWPEPDGHQRAPIHPRELNAEHLENLHRAIDAMDNILVGGGITHKLVLNVLHRHLSNVLDGINTKSGNPGRSGGEDAQSHMTFDILRTDTTELGQRERDFMALYFYDIRPKALRADAERRPGSGEEQASYDIHQQLPRDEGSDEPGLEGDEPAQGGGGGDGRSIGDAAGSSSSGRRKFSKRPTTPGVVRVPTKLETAQKNGNKHQKERQDKTWKWLVSDDIAMDRNQIWCALVFRMICWLLLHNFDKEDVQLPKSELLGNRLPVYIM